MPKSTPTGNASRPTQPVKLYSKAVVLGYRRGKRMQQPQTAVIKIQGVQSKPDTKFYQGKRVAYIFRAKTAKRNGTQESTKTRVMWGRVGRAHGTNGAVRVKFRTTVPPRAFGARCRVMMYPSRV